MVTLQEQFELACALARANPHQHIAIVCTYAQFRAINYNLKPGEVFLAQSARIQFPNGALMSWVDSNSESVIPQCCGAHFTTLFVTDSVNNKTVTYLQSRLRSSKFKGAFKTYYAQGYATWLESEIYGG